MNAFQVISIALLSVLAANAQVIAPGRCPKPAVQKDFDTTRYLGKWYEIQRLPNLFQKGDCCTATYSLKSPGVVGVLNSELLSDGNISSVVGTAVTADPSEPAKLLVSFFENSPRGPYWVLSTDYDNHALVYSCTDAGLFHVNFAWILSRQPTLPEETLEDLNGILSSIGVKLDKLITTNQDAATCSVMQQ
ncbi:apolipoprotein Da, duplicate 2 [Cynoglossus semilaevis]|uniref:Apolipoprotein D n=1 Tax=Cynoglossus semilaevis TaxID=244447 RepID=A0A3P8W739_CYNSE|nr:apolipoprotein D-like [Cynoglossus semilaevis]XP_024922164.1 apolipoprotein D-like [Cynoglossus semilaevis]